MRVTRRGEDPRAACAWRRSVPGLAWLGLGWLHEREQRGYPAGVFDALGVRGGRCE